VPEDAEGAGAVARPTHLLYLHGFRSSPRSFKAQRLLGWLREHAPDVHAWCPQLPPSPREAMALVAAGIAGWPADRSVVVGSSLGGYYATAVAQRHGWRGVLLNPAVDPARDLERHIGEQTAFHDPQERFFFQPAYIAELQALHAGPLTRPEQLLAVVATGDEVLDWREMVARYDGAKIRLVQGSDHALSDFDAHLPTVLEHLTLCD
jgi:hypothetical protein